MKPAKIAVITLFLFMAISGIGGVMLADNRRQRDQQRPLNDISRIESAQADNDRRAERIRPDR